jgi:amidohydrolase
MNRLACAAVLLIAASTSFAGGGATPQVIEQMRAIAEKQYPSLEAFYKTLHREPDLSLSEEKTSRRLAEQLRSAGFEVTEHVGGFGVVGVLRNGPGKTLLIRTDLDALPVKEQTGAAYHSTVQVTSASGESVDVMHACGHDVHVTCLSGVARAMTEMKDRWKGTLVLIGQPAEEVGRGAVAMLKDGLFTRFPRPDWCLALHVDAEVQAGQIGYVSGYAMANVDSVDVVIRGIGGHGAMPHKTKDPVVIAAQTIMALQTIDSREIDPLQPVVVTVGAIHGGTKHNIIPDEVTLQLTVRSYTDDVRDTTLKAIDRIVKGTAAAAGVPEDRAPTVTIRDAEFTPATYNTPELVDRVLSVLKRTLGEQNVIKREPVMGGEDFSRYGREEPKIPIFMYRLGSISPQRMAESKKPGGKPLPSLHSATYLPEPTVTIRTGVTTMTAAAIDLLQ